MRFICYAVAFFLVLASCQDSAPKKSEIEKEVREAPQDYVEKVSDEIIESPNNPNLYIKRALAYQDRGLMELARKDVKRALSIDSTASYFHQVLGEINFLDGELRPARLSLEKATKLDDSNTDAWLKLAEVYFILRRYEEAIDAVNEALRIDDQLEQGYFIKGYVYKELGDTTRAKSSFQTTIEVNPDHYEAYMELGSLYAFQGNPLALEYFNSALDLKPKSAEAFYHKGMFLQAGSKYDEARNTYQKLLQADPNNVLAYYNLGYLHLTEYLNFDTAALYFDSVLTVQPDYVEAMYNKGLAYEEMELYGEAETAYRNALSINPQYDPAAKGLSRILE